MKNILQQIFILSIILSGISLAQIKSIIIWPDKVPNSIYNKDYKVVVDSDANWTYTRNIANPNMDMYPAPANISNGTAVVICPGGGYWGLAFKHEGAQVAKWFNSFGVTAFVLKYRLPDDAIMVDKKIGPLQDAQEAIRIVRRKAKEWNINPDKVGIMGFSAGGHLAATLSTHFDDKVYEQKDNTSARPDFSILIYPVISMDESITHMGSRESLLGKNPSSETVKYFSNELQVNEKTPPAFLVCSFDDDAVPILNSINYFLALKKYNVNSELHIYEKGGHGYGLGKSGGTESAWPEACKYWLKAKGLL
ncbi:MAG: alpha/beta hydrolase [Clostridiales bacterium 43-6]|nr:MAG: alpha/beta hydrolase [Clostridiales bacterium 43-6]